MAFLSAAGSNYRICKRVGEIIRSSALVLGLGLILGAHALENDTLVIDVRTPEEWGRGHLLSATRLDWQSIANMIGTLAESVDQKIVLYCHSGNRSGKAKDILNEMGYTNVVNAGSVAEAQNLLQDKIVQ